MNTAKGLIKGSFKEGNWEGEVKFSSLNAQIPFQNAFAFTYSPKREFSVTDFTLDFPDGTMSGYINYNEPKHLFDGCLFANVKHLDRFAFLAQEPINLGGSLAAEVRLEPTGASFINSSQDLGERGKARSKRSGPNDESIAEGSMDEEEDRSGKAAAGRIPDEFTKGAPYDEQNVQLVLIGKNLRYRDMLLDDMTISSRVSNVFEDPRGQFNLLVEKFFSPRMYLTRLNFNTNSDEMNWPFYLDVDGRMENPFHCFAKGFWRNQKSYFNLELTQLFGDLANTPFALKFPCEYQLGPEVMNLSQFDFQIGKGRLYTTFELSPARALGKWELEHFPLEIFSVIKPRWTLNGCHYQQRLHRCDA